MRRIFSLAVPILLVATAALGAADRAPTLADVPPNGLSAPPDIRSSSVAGVDPAIATMLGPDAPSDPAAAHGLKVAGESIHVNIVTETTAVPRIAQQLESAGGRHVLTAWNQVEAWLTPAQITAVAADPEVHLVRRPSYFVLPEHDVEQLGPKAGAVVSEAVDASGAARWHHAGYTGHGLRIGIIDTQFARIEELAGTELPPRNQIERRDFTGEGFPTSRSAVHGTACAEVVYDMAPGLERLLLAQVSTPVEIANAADWLRNRGADIVSMSLGWLSWGPGDGTGDLADVVDSFTSGRRLWVNSAGNSALAHWQGQWRDADGDGWLDFDTGSEVSYVTWDGEILVEFPGRFAIGTAAALVWDQWHDVRTDLDLCLVRWDGFSTELEVVDCAGTDNSLSGQPAEDLITATDGWGYYGFAVWRASGPAVVGLELFNRFDGLPLAHRTALGSMVPPSDAAGAIATAAVDVVSGELEAYSSWGPTNGPLGAVVGGHLKPDLAGFANVSTDSYGPGVFNGTSAAAPHVAGAAALLWSAYPDQPRWWIRSVLEEAAADVGLVGQDVQFGHGVLRLPPPPGSGVASPLPELR